jgi:hypothetical protein
MSTKDDGGPAFPTTPENFFDMDPPGTGLSIRDYFAARVLVGMFAADTNESYVPLAKYDDRAKLCYRMADAMLKARVQP